MTLQNFLLRMSLWKRENPKLGLVSGYSVGFILSTRIYRIVLGSGYSVGFILSTRICRIVLGSGYSAGYNLNTRIGEIGLWSGYSVVFILGTQIGEIGSGAAINNAILYILKCCNVFTSYPGSVISFIRSNSDEKHGSRFQQMAVKFLQNAASWNLNAEQYLILNPIFISPNIDQIAFIGMKAFFVISTTDTYNPGCGYGWNLLESRSDFWENPDIGTTFEWKKTPKTTLPIFYRMNHLIFSFDNISL